MGKIGVSQNNYPVYDDTARYARFTAGGRGFWAADDDVATVLHAWVEWFAANIEPIIEPGEVYDDWSYAVRPVRGQTTGYSNHGSATAIDINATQHPRGVRNTFTPMQRGRLAAGLKLDRFCDNSGRPVIRAGEFYESTIDGMHFEINATPPQVAQSARKLRALQAEDDDMQLNDTVELNPTDRQTLGLKPGQDASVALLLRRAALSQGKADQLAQEVDDLKGQLSTVTVKLDQVLAKLST